MLDVLKGHLDEDQLQPAKVEELFGKQMTGTLTSPCDCVVAQQMVADGQYANKDIVTLGSDEWVVFSTSYGGYAFKK